MAHQGRQAARARRNSVKRREVLPDVPSIAEAVPGYEGDDWTGISAARNTPSQIVDILNTAVNAALADPAFAARLADLGVEPFPSSPAAFGKFIGDYTEKWAKVIPRGEYQARVIRDVAEYEPYAVLYSSDVASAGLIDDGKVAASRQLSPPYLAPRSRWIIRRMNGSGSLPR